MCPTKVGQVLEIQGSATLCFSAVGGDFQGVIHAEEDAQYALYGTQVPPPGGRGRRWSQAPLNANADCDSSSAPASCASECGEAEAAMYDIRIVDCEVGAEYTLRRVTLRGEALTFRATHVFRGTRADMEAQTVIGHRAEGSVHKGPIAVRVAYSLQSPHRTGQPWLL